MDLSSFIAMQERRLRMQLAQAPSREVMPLRAESIKPKADVNRAAEMATVLKRLGQDEKPRVISRDACSCGRSKRSTSTFCNRCQSRGVLAQARLNSDRCACGAKKRLESKHCRPCALAKGWIRRPVPRCGCGRKRQADRQRCDVCIGKGRNLRRSA